MYAIGLSYRTLAPSRRVSPNSFAAVSTPFGEMAQHLELNLPRNPERTVALRKLLEAKDAAVRAAGAGVMFPRNQVTVGRAAYKSQDLQRRRDRR
jgi:hypothetical protein